MKHNIPKKDRPALEKFILACQAYLPKSLFKEQNPALEFWLTDCWLQGVEPFDIKTLYLQATLRRTRPAYEKIVQLLIVTLTQKANDHHAEFLKDFESNRSGPYEGQIEHKAKEHNFRIYAQMLSELLHETGSAATAFVNTQGRVEKDLREASSCSRNFGSNYMLNTLTKVSKLFKDATA